MVVDQNETPDKLKTVLSLKELIAQIRAHPDVAFLDVILSDEIEKFNVIKHDFKKTKDEDN